MPTEGGLFDQIATDAGLLAATADSAWLQAMLDAEAALARAQADAGLLNPGDAAAIAAACHADAFDVASIGAQARLGGNPVIPLVAALRGAVPEGARDWVHHGATSQDILDTAAMLVVRRALSLMDGDLAGLSAACAALAERHRHSLMAGRTLLQHALPISFGLKAAGWLVAVTEVRRALLAVSLPVQLGGAAGTLASLGPHGLDVAQRMAGHLGLSAPLLPWHTNRLPVAAPACQLAMAAGVVAKIATDIALLMQSEVAEASEPAAPGRGGSSALPQKRNPVGCAAAIAAARRAHALLGPLLAGMAGEHERAAGGWQAEWETLTDLLRAAGGAFARTREVVAGLEVDPARMRANLDADGGLILAERVTLSLAARVGYAAARDAVEAAVARARAGGTTFAAALRACTPLTESEIGELLDASGYLGASGAMIDRALAAFHQGA